MFWSKCGNVIALFIVGLFLFIGSTPARTIGELATLNTGIALSDDDVFLQRIERAIGTGDVRLLFQDAADRIVITLFGEELLYSRGQAVYVLQDFFRRNPPEGFTFQERRKTERGQFVAGIYRVQGDSRPLRVYVQIRMKDGQWELRAVRIEAFNQR